MSKQTSAPTCLFIHQRSPHGSTNPIESMDMAYALSAFEHPVSFLFMGAGVWQLVHDQHTQGLGFKDFSAAFKAWDDYDIQHLYVAQTALDEFELKAQQLIVEVEPVNQARIQQLFSEYQFIFND